MTEFQRQVVIRVQAIPFGKVVSYGQIAASISNPRAARQVGWIMRSLEMGAEIPWWRVMNNQRKMTVGGEGSHESQRQKQLLEAEGIIVSKSYTIAIEKYRYQFSAVNL